MGYIDFNGRIAFVTGAGSGLGRASAVALAKAGAKVFVADINRDGLDETVAAITQFGGDAAARVCDVSSDDDVRSAVEDAVAHFGGLHIAVNSAGIDGRIRPFAELTLEEWHRCIAINLDGVASSMRYQIPAMLASGQGSIVNISSVAGLLGVSAMAEYTASKHAVIGLTRSVAADYARSNIRVNAICPGAILTEMTRQHTHDNPELQEQMASASPMRRLGQPEEIADAVVWLASDRSSYVTGQAIAVDGGSSTIKA